jgi:small subunit ribosomal protein S17
VSTVQEQTRKLRRQKEGEVIGTKMDKTIIVRVDRRIRHRLYKKELKRSKKYYAHDETEKASMGDWVQIMETRPMSKLKRWRLVEVVRSGKMQ